MQVRVTRAGGLMLADPDDFTRFSVGIEDEDKIRARSELGKIARIEGGHAWIAQDAIRALAPRASEPGWQSGFGKMVAFASKKGWLDGQNAIRAHIEQCPSEHSPISIEQFRGSMRHHATGVAILATGDGKERRGLTLSALSSVTADPPTLLACVNTNSATHDAIRQNDSFSINLLSAAQRDLAMRFAGQHGVSGHLRFDDGAWTTLQTGAPILRSALCAMDCKLQSHQRIGTHSVFIGMVVGAMEGRGSPLVNYQGAMREFGVL